MDAARVSANSRNGEVLSFIPVDQLAQRDALGLDMLEPATGANGSLGFCGPSLRIGDSIECGVGRPVSAQANLYAVNDTLTLPFAFLDSCYG